MKKPNVSGQFYSGNKKQLLADIDTYWARAQVAPYAHRVDIIISPHAGYMFSGPVAAYAYKAASRYPYKTVVILAPSHFVGFDGISVWRSGAFETPLGVVDVDGTITEKLLAAHEKIFDDPRVFAREHSLEVQIPFIQKAFPGARIVPIVVGQPGPEVLAVCADALGEIVGSREDVLIVVSTDMSHYHEAAVARAMDLRTIEMIKSLDPQKVLTECTSGRSELCGVLPVTIALLYARRKGLDVVDVLHYAHSGDVTGDMSQVVGYTAIAVYGAGKHNTGTSAKNEMKETPVHEITPQSLSAAQQKRLLEIARATIEAYVRGGKTLEFSEDDPRLSLEEGAFVTIHKKGELRGCIGNIIGRGSLQVTVRNMAIAAATQDPRFPSVRPEELAEIDVEISVLSKPRTIKSVDEIVLGTHGVIVSRGFYNQGVFLPQVATDTGWTKEEFLSQLCYQKAHLPPDAWKDPRTKIEVFTAEVFSEKGKK